MDLNHVAENLALASLLCVACGGRVAIEGITYPNTPSVADYSRLQLP